MKNVFTRRRDRKKKEQEIQLRRWCVEMSKMFRAYPNPSGFAAKEAQEIYDWVISGNPRSGI
jgi:hypothetical protein